MAENKNVSVADLSPPDFDGFMTKCGGSVQSWKRRWFVLKGNQLYYFKKKTDKKATGVIALSKESFVKEDATKKAGKPCIAVGTVERVFFMYPDTNQEQTDWLRNLNGVVDRLKGTSGGSSGTANTNITTSTGGSQTSTANTNQTAVTNSGNTTTQNTTGGITSSNTNTNTGNTTTTTQNTTGNTTGGNTTPSNTNTTTATTPVAGGGATTTTPQSTASSGGSVLSKAKDVVPFMIEDPNKVLEFWNIWFESIPKQGNNNGNPQYQLVISCDGGELSWRSFGPQNIFIQKMVDFFWNVGAPESEIDRLNDFGALVNPISIGSWINMSKIGGMDGGWFFPVPIALKIGFEACDPDSPEVVAGGATSQVVKAVQQWTEANNINECIYVGRDMGAAPPRQTEIRIRLSQPTVADQLNVALSAFKAFRFPEVPAQFLNILRQFTNPGIILSLITSSEGFVKIGILFPQPVWSVALQLIDEGRKLGSQISANVDVFNKLNNVFQCSGPDFIEFQYLTPGFGYNVYKEEFNVFLHYKGN